MDHWKERKLKKERIDETHIIGKPRSEQFSAGGVPRLYAVFECTKCQFGYAEGPLVEVQGYVKKLDVGFFIDPELFSRCPNA